MAKDFSLNDLEVNRVGTFTKDHGEAVCPIDLVIVGLEPKTFGQGADAETKDHIIFKTTSGEPYPKTLPLSVSRKIQLEDIFPMGKKLGGETVRIVMADFEAPRMGTRYGVVITKAE